MKLQLSIAFYFLCVFLTINLSISSAEDVETPESTENILDAAEQEHHQIDDEFVESALHAEILWFDYGEETSIASRHETPLTKAPSIVTVITGEEIKHMGYRTFAEVLRTVPGFEVLKMSDFGDVIPAVRGLKASNRVRLMIDGHFVNNPLRGDAFGNFDDFPVQNIKKIEIIRGPGSAIYGENAFLSAINIITKTGSEIKGVRVNSGFGSYDTVEGNIVFGEVMGDFEISGMINYRDTNGYDGTIESDNQSIIDSSLSPFGFDAASQAPGEVEDWRREYDLDLKTMYKDLYFHGWYSNKNRGPFVGPQYALTDETNLESNYVFGEFGYEKKFEDRLAVKPRVYYDQFDNDSYVEALPDGTTFPSDSNGDGSYDFFYTYPEGFIGNGKQTQRIAGAEIPFDCTLFDGNLLTVGFEYRFISQTNVQYYANYDPETYEPLGSVEDFSDSYPYIKDAIRRIWSVYLQDSWDITDTLNITLGARFDEYSDFGDAFSPRSGLTWQFMENTYVKFLYGEAFRAPSFVEMFTINQPAITGNEDLDAEEIRTFEVELGHKFNNHLKGSLTFFDNDIEDLIVLETLESAQESSRYENFGDAHIQGIEAEIKIDILNGNYIFMNYTFQDPQDDDGSNLPFVAKHKGNFGVNTNPWKYTNINLSTFFSGKRYREADDARDDMPSYALLNLSVIAKEFFNTMEVQGTIFNLLDKDYDDPGPVSIQDDLPRPGRTFFLGMSYQF
ncbi:MAG: TonB-dependent receptor [Planctomycetes bacterium]|nr:TonB-dependent receptor [Planctomycetota bacterium]